MNIAKNLRLSVAGRIALSLVLLSTFTLILVQPLGILPRAQQLDLQRKTVLCESLSISCSLLARRNDYAGVEENLHAVVQRNPEILSACLRRADGQVLAEFGDHSAHWYLPPGAVSTPHNIYVPISSQDQEWGTVEVSFRRATGLAGWIGRYPLFCWALVTLTLNGIIFRLYMGRVLTYLDPSKSVPTHVRSTLDTFAEGVLVLDDENRIVLANEAFAQQMGDRGMELQGKAVDRLPWSYAEDSEPPPWEMRGAPPTAAQPRTGVKLNLRADDQSERTFLVNTSPILAEDGSTRGTIASFDDITLMERKKQELSRMLVELKASRNELAQRNQELQYLATRDPLTGCLNRRSFFEMFDKLWQVASRHEIPLSCYMVDVDHFKSINDQFGHGLGDEVLRRVAQAISESARDNDVVCRYGGEEFCVLLPQTDIDKASLAAERVRTAIEDLVFDDLSVTASLGVSSFHLGASDPQGLLDQADQSLYVAKRSGRNQVMRWDEVPGDINEPEPTSQAQNALQPTGEPTIPYAAVTSLLSALAYRDADTAAHCTRVAELSVATARGLMSQQEVYTLEIAALLHDIGKIGVPDSILLKPAPLTQDEWETMKLHDRIGVEIIEASFANQLLVDFVRYHHATFAVTPEAPEMPQGKDIPLGARIVSIVDAFDAMVSDRPYRKGRSPDEAFAELRRCSGQQFDPDLVERFIRVATVFGATQLQVSSKQSALQIGLQIEKLAQAVDAQDVDAIKALATRLESTAAYCQVSAIEEFAAEIKQAVDEDGDMMTLINMVCDLMALCSATQKIYADVPPRTGSATALRHANLGDRPADPPAIAKDGAGGLVLVQHRFEQRENRVALSLSQRRQAGRFFDESRAGNTRDIERRLKGDGDAPDVLLRIAANGDVNLTQLVARCPHVIFDSIAGLKTWALLSDDALPTASTGHTL